MDALDLVRQEVDAFNSANGGKGGVAHVAQKIGMPRSSLSAYLNGSYPAASTKNVETKILRELVGRVHCPHQGMSIVQSDCDALSTRAMPLSGKHAIRQWKACCTCPNKKGAPHVER